MSSARRSRIANIFEDGKLVGPQIYIIRLASRLRDRIEMIFFIPKKNSAAFRKKCDEADLDYFSLNLNHITKDKKAAIRYLSGFIFEVAGLVSELRKRDFDLVYACGGSWQYKAAIAGKLAGRKVVWHLNDTYMPWIIRTTFKMLSGLADGYIYASQRSRNYYKSLVKEGRPEFVIPAPVDTSQFDPLQNYSGDEGLIREWAGKIIIGTVANINPIKGLEVLLHAAANLNERVNNIHFVVVGPVYPSQRRYFENLQMLRKALNITNIDFVGRRSDIRPLLKRFDIYVCSSHAESSPISVWEAMAMAKPVVSTNVGDVPFYILDDKSGFTVDVNNPEKLADKLARLVEDEDLRQQFGHRAQEMVKQELDTKHCAERHVRAFRVLMGEEEQK